MSGPFSHLNRIISIEQGHRLSPRLPANLCILNEAPWSIVAIMNKATYPRDPNGLWNSLLDDTTRSTTSRNSGKKKMRWKRDEKGRREREAESQIGGLHFVLDFWAALLDVFFTLHSSVVSLQSRAERWEWRGTRVKMSVCTQLGLLLWKNFTYRRRQTVRTTHLFSRYLSAFLVVFPSAFTNKNNIYSNAIRTLPIMLRK